jgi:sulfatase modifying factor 1
MRLLPRPIVVTILCAGCANLRAPTAWQDSRPQQAAQPTSAPAEPRKPFQVEIPGTGYRVELRPIPGDAKKGIAPFWMAKTETTWEAYDPFQYPPENERPGAKIPSEARTRPTSSYLPPDRGYGHQGYAAITISHMNATRYCAWLSEKAGMKFRLPTEAEWEHACRGGAVTAYCFGDDPKQLGDHAWFKDNADRKPHPVGTRKPNAFGLHDMHGNVAEWCDGPEGKGFIRGGSFLDPAELCRCDSRLPDNPDWNDRDPEDPKSFWWLADGHFIGFRLVCTSNPPQGK